MNIYQTTPYTKIGIGTLLRVGEDDYLLIKYRAPHWHACRASTEIWMASHRTVIVADPDTRPEAYTWLLFPELQLSLHKDEDIGEGKLAQPWGQIADVTDVALGASFWGRQRSKDPHAPAPGGLITGPPATPLLSRWYTTQHEAHQLHLTALGLYANYRAALAQDKQGAHHAALFRRLQEMVRVSTRGLQAVLEALLDAARADHLDLDTVWEVLPTHAAPGAIRGLTFTEADLTIESRGDTLILTHKGEEIAEAELMALDLTVDDLVLS